MNSDSLADVASMIKGAVGGQIACSGMDMKICIACGITMNSEEGISLHVGGNGEPVLKQDNGRDECPTGRIEQ